MAPPRLIHKLLDLLDASREREPKGNAHLEIVAGVPQQTHRGGGGAGPGGHRHLATAHSELLAQARQKQAHGCVEIDPQDGSTRVITY